MELTTLTNQELTLRLESLRGTERETTLKIIYHLVELERRKYYRELGYSSLFYYCTQKLGYAEASAARRIAGARCIRDNPELAELFLQGKVTLCSIATAASSIAKQVTEVTEIVGKSQREVQAIVAKAEPVMAKPKEVIRPVVVAAPAAPLLPPMPAQERVEIRFSVPKEVYSEYEEAKAKLSNALGKSLSVESVFAKLLELYLKPKERNSARGNTSSRYIPRSVRREVYRRDGGKCAFVAPDGTRCCQNKFLHIDHITPYALGGKTELSNLRLLCSAHNQLEAEKVFGKWESIEKLSTIGSNVGSTIS